MTIVRMACSTDYNSVMDILSVYWYRLVISRELLKIVRGFGFQFRYFLEAAAVVGIIIKLSLQPNRDNFLGCFFIHKIRRQNQNVGIVVSARCLGMISRKTQ